MSASSRARSAFAISVNSTPIPSDVVLRTVERARISPSGTASNTESTVPKASGLGVSIKSPPRFRSLTRDTLCFCPSICQATQTPLGVCILGYLRLLFAILSWMSPGDDGVGADKIISRVYAYGVTSGTEYISETNRGEGIREMAFPIVTQALWRQSAYSKVFCLRKGGAE
jgi:hypothetical protein